ncbi:MAG TPA: phosphomannomutase/phosphoglucomutase [Tahibacter sp.]|uniref:phosphomannomutase/phosphoglucomutase n=1 Tax=Tahibacter sp. TaxID=2056211 RepID=UPI002BABE5FE|nr:phosphomannomutase/phosphoglucomutase [Tahibacter sp.]HSX61052.1 phosphomannomutase/phosphoglucomutase [Tahibacter sp.]
MKKKQGDAARNGAGEGGDRPAASRLKLPALDWRRLLPISAATVLAAAALFFAWQVVQVWREQAALSNLALQRQAQSQSLAEVIGGLRERISAALHSPAVMQPLQSGDPAQREAAIAALRAAMPEVVEVYFFSAELKEVLGSDLRTFGYAKAAQLIQAQSGSADAQSVVIGKNGRMITFAETVKAGTQDVAVAWVAIPMQPVFDAFSTSDIGDGRLELRQGTGNPTDLVLLGIGAGGAAGPVPDLGLPVAGTAFRVAQLPPQLFVLVSDNPWLPLVLAFVFGIAALVALWLRKVGWHEGMAVLRGKLVKGKAEEPEVTMAEVLQAEARPARTPRAPPAGGPKPAAAAPSSASRLPLDRSIFRAYDIRGVVGKTLDRDIARQIGRAIGSEGVERGLSEIVVGRDGRLSGPDLAAGLIEGLRQAGMNVIDIGQVPTPLVYYATYQLNTGSGISLTGSHNPPDYNGFKIVLGGETLAEQAIQSLYVRIAENRFTSGNGTLQSMDVKADYIDRVVGDIQVDGRLRVVVDCGNGVPGLIAPAVLEGIGCEVMPLYCDVDGEFPNHHPDPSDLRNLRDLILTVKQVGADLGLAFDGDGDRLGVVTKTGEVIFPDRLLMLFAKDVLVRNPGATIIYDVKCTGKLQPEILKHGGSPIMWKTGHSLIKAKMRETEAELAGEMSGHFFFKERWYGFDDGIYAAARLLEILAGDMEGRDPQQIFDSLAKGTSTPELKIEMHEGEHYRFIERFRERASFEGARVTTIDGVRADWPDGWGLVRASNTTPVLVLRFDADNEQTLLRIQDVFRRQLLALDPNLKLPF